MPPSRGIGAPHNTSRSTRGSGRRGVRERSQASPAASPAAGESGSEADDEGTTDALPSGLVGRDGHWVAVTASLAALTGGTVGTLVGTAIEALAADDERDRLRRWFQGVVASGRADHAFTTDVVSPRAARRAVVWTLVPLLDALGTVHHVVATMRPTGGGARSDVRALSSAPDVAPPAAREGEVSPADADAKMRLADRLAAVGALAAGVAHEINNPLAYVLMNLEYLARELGALRADLGVPGARPPDARGARPDPITRLGEVTRVLGDVSHGAERVRHVVRDLQRFARADDASRGPVDVEAVLESSLNIARGTLTGRAQLLRDYQRVPPVLANECSLGQVFLNLLVNAAQAIPPGDPEAHEVRVATWLDADDRVVVEVRDTGVGIAPEHITRLFEAFFTTKPPGVGTGLGLAICHGIVTALGGTIEVDSAPGRGSAFRVALPALRAARRPSTPPRPVAALERRGRVLVVDDEPLFRESLRRVLAGEFDVATEADGRKALARIAEGARYDAILADLMMPGLDGAGLHAALEVLAPDQAARLVILSGAVSSPDARAFLDRVPHLPKPCDPKALFALLRDRVRRHG